MVRALSLKHIFRRQVAQRAVWAYLVVIDPPGFDDLSRAVQCQKPVLVEAFLAELAMKALDAAVLPRPAWGDEVQRDLVLVSPLVQCLGRELGAAIDHRCRARTSASVPSV
jgi:hypothetical protein